MTGGDEAGSGSAERLTFFSDAVVAIALTLLALDLPVPPLAKRNADALQFMRDNRDAYLAFLISFLVIANNWLGHHRIFGYVTRFSHALARWNMLWLLMIVLTPFATRTLTGNGAFQVRFILYASVQALSGLFFALMVREMARANLLRADTPPGVVRNSYARLLVVTAAFLVSIPVALLTHWAYVCWVAIPVGSRAVRRFTGRKVLARS